VLDGVVLGVPAGIVLDALPGVVLGVLGVLPEGVFDVLPDGVDGVLGVVAFFLYFAVTVTSAFTFCQALAALSQPVKV
jgi:hypothetical protein